jgi:hypothetical protein
MQHCFAAGNSDLFILETFRKIRCVKTAWSPDKSFCFAVENSDLFVLETFQKNPLRENGVESE